MGVDPLGNAGQGGGFLDQLLNTARRVLGVAGGFKEGACGAIPQIGLNIEKLSPGAS